LPDAAGDAEAVVLTEGERAENQQVQGALQQVCSDMGAPFISPLV